MIQANIILTGFMGTGKTTVGQLLADKTGYQFIDTDARIEQQVEKTITEIFSTQGEEVFRQMETELVKQLATESRRVIATGGGLILNPDNVVRLKQSGVIFCLTATPEEILHRISQQQHNRPLLEKKHPLEEIKVLLEQRITIYGQFIQISTENKTPKSLVDEILNLHSPTI